MTVHGTCIDCGETYLTTNGYQGYYCPDCHSAWQTKQRPAPRSRRLRLSGRSWSRSSRASSNADATDRDWSGPNRER